GALALRSRGATGSDTILRASELDACPPTCAIDRKDSIDDQNLFTRDPLSSADRALRCIVEQILFNGANPRCNGASPSSNRASPRCNGASPSSNGASPSCNGAGPSFSGAGPSFNGAGPSCNGAGPSSDRANPNSNGATPTCTGANCFAWASRSR